MGKLFTLSDDVKKIAADAIDDLIDQLGKDCMLVYPHLPVPCINCIPDPIGNKSSNHWNAGGPIPFPNAAICPMCDGSGFHFEEQTKNIRLLISNTPAAFYANMPAGIVMPAGTIQTKGYIKDMSDVLQSRKLIVQTTLEPMIRYTYDLLSEPIDQGNIVQNRYWVALWNRVGA
jgi:hypothetical protein